jgi:anti-sigma regulatory factor (Ser/Thr protein kinase)
MVKPDDAILLYSDGVVEEENSDGEPFGVSRLLEAVKSSNHIDHVIDEVNQRLDTFCEGTEQADDVSIVVVPVQPYQQRRTALDSEVTRELLQGQWCWSLVLKGAQLGRVEPVPLAIAQIADLIKSDGHAETLFTILTELYVNALDHGILGLDSSIKETELGFIEYFELREKKLAEIQEGMIRFDIKLEDSRRGLGIRMRVQDSGPGFDYQKTIDALEQNSGNSGRGIALVNELASSLSYSGDGNIVEAFYMLS